MLNLSAMKVEGNNQWGGWDEAFVTMDISYKKKHAGNNKFYDKKNKGKKNTGSSLYHRCCVGKFTSVIALP